MRWVRTAYVKALADSTAGGTAGITTAPPATAGNPTPAGREGLASKSLSIRAPMCDPHTRGLGLALGMSGFSDVWL